MKKILIISTNADEAGAPRHVEILVRELMDRYKFYIVFGERGPVADRLCALGIDVVYISGLRSEIELMTDIKVLLKLYQVIKRVSPHIIHTHSAKASFLGRICALISRTKSVYTVHGWGWRGKSFLVASVIWFIEFLMARFVNTKYVFVAECVKRDANKYLMISSFNGTVIHNGVPAVNFKRNCIYKNPSNFRVSFLMPARVSPAKDHETLFLAFGKLEGFNFQLILCGAGTDDKSFVEFARKCSPLVFQNFSFIGQTSEVENILADVDVVLLISNYEALPLSIIEAMSYRKCIIATNVGGVAELIQQQYSGILVNKGNSNDLHMALVSIFDAEARERLSANAGKVFDEKFSSKLMAEKTARIYDSA